jgi:GR25 family glycosyltransferase involved in LPS biosynthesis
MDEAMKCYVINLDSRADRMANFEHEAHHAGIAYERVRATTPSDCHVPRSFILPAGSYANGISHKRIWQMLIDSGDEYACIFEDDAVWRGEGVFDPDLCIEAVRSSVDNVDMLFLGGNHTEYGAVEGVHVSGDLYRCGHTLTGHAYIISRYAAQHIIDNHNFDKTAIDAGWKPLHDMGRCYYYEPSLWVQRPDFSDIWGRYVDYRGCIK